ncbi:MAG: YceI family protein [Saprospiraceae bacterium]|nr:YceI family protein [Saprospiraceae bacterium]
MPFLRNFYGVMLIFLWCMNMGAVLMPPTVKKYFTIERESKLYLNGSTNVNHFTCHCEDRFNRQMFTVEKRSNQANFTNTGLQIRSDNFNCRNRKIEADMEKALKANQFPNIKISLLETKQDVRCLDPNFRDWFDVQAKVSITITNATKTETIQARARCEGNNRFRLIGKTDLRMSNFGVAPPEAMFGMIKVNDDITFNFDLVVLVEDLL